MRELLTLCFILITSGSFCQTEKQLLPSDLRHQTIVTEPSTLRKGYFRAGLAISHGIVDKYFTAGGHKEYGMLNSWGASSSGTLILQYGITDRLQIESYFIYMRDIKEIQNTVYFPAADTNAYYSYDLKGRGFGDCSFSVRYQIIPEKENKLSLTGRFDLTVPTGQKNPENIKDEFHFDPPVGYGHLDMGFHLTARKIRYPYSYSTYFAYTYKFKGHKLFDAADTEEKEFRDGARINLGGTFNVHLNDWIALSNELNYFRFGQTKIVGIVQEVSVPAWTINYQPGFVFQVKRFRISEAVQVPLKGKSVAADPMYVVIAQYTF